jgi:hypothetical protein
VIGENRRIVAIAWYSREDYREIRELMDDGYVLPEDYELWRRRAGTVLLIERARGSIVLRARILPVPFAAWCDATNQRPDVHARTRHVNLAIEDYCAGFTLAAPAGFEHSGTG